MKYTPYLIYDNLLECIKELNELNRIYTGPHQIISHFILKLNHPLIGSMCDKEYFEMLRKLIEDALVECSFQGGQIGQQNQTGSR